MKKYEQVDKPVHNITQGRLKPMRFEGHLTSLRLKYRLLGN